MQNNTGLLVTVAIVVLAVIAGFVYFRGGVGSDDGMTLPTYTPQASTSAYSSVSPAPSSSPSATPSNSTSPSPSSSANSTTNININLNSSPAPTASTSK